jgi:cytoskeletal protein CcmA (bactofilin family)
LPASIDVFRGGVVSIFSKPGKEGGEARESPEKHPQPEKPAGDYQFVQKHEIKTNDNRREVITIIGQGIKIKGELFGDEDIVIEGEIEGKINIKKDLEIGQSGCAKADVYANNIKISGKVYGNVYANNKVELISTGFLEGDIKAPKVVISEGAHFRGSVDMGEVKEEMFKEAGLKPPKPQSVKPADAKEDLKAL